MESLESSLNEIGSPWQSKLRSLLVNPHQFDLKFHESCDGFGIVTSSTTEWLEIEMGIFKPFCGVSVAEPQQQGTISFEGLSFLVVPSKSWIGFSGGYVKSIDPLLITMTKDSKLWFIPELCHNMAFSACHLFSGAVCGWSRALQWLQSESMIHVDATIAVDSDETVMRVWDLQQSFDSASKTKMHYENIDLTTCVERINGVVLPVGNRSWYNLCRIVPNLIFTLSPPCQTWSAGGTYSGFEHANGYSMAESIESIKCVRPLLALFECADRIVKHPNYPLIKKLMCFCGYKLVWTSVMTLHNLTGMNRTRWLAVWMRIDLPSAVVQSITSLGNVNSVTWDHKMYDFILPYQMEHQLKLSTSLSQIYGDVRLLPKNKRSFLCSTPTVEQVLESRCLKGGEILPTVVASYSKQHEIACGHVAERGIFASLVQKVNGVSFIDPLRCLALLGVPSNQCAFVARKIDIAFRHIGNALSVQQALTCVLIALQSVGIQHGPIQNIAVNCWSKRITATKVLILRVKDFFVLTPPKVLDTFFSEQGPISVDSNDELHILLPNDELIGSFNSKLTIKDLIHWIGFEKPVEQGIACFGQQGEILMNDSVGKFGGCDLFLKFKGIDVLHLVVRARECDLQEISPTIPFSIRDASVVPCIEQYRDLNLRPCPESTCRKKIGVTIFVYGVDQPIFTEWIGPLNDELIENSLRNEVCETGSRVPLHWCEAKTIKQDPCNQRVFLVEIAPCELIPKNLVRVVHSIDQQQVVIGVDKQTTPIQIALAIGTGCEHATVNHSYVHLLDQLEFRDGDCITLGISNIGHITDNARKKITTRIRSLSIQSSNLAIDELLFCGRILGTKNPNFKIMQPRQIDECAFSDGLFVHIVQQGFVQFQFQNDMTFVIPLLLPNHWCAIEVHSSANCIFVVGLPIQYQQIVLRVLSERTHQRACTMRIEFVDINFPGLCGWALLKRWFEQNEACFPSLPIDLCFEIVGQTQADMLKRISVADMTSAMPTANFALQARNAFIVAIQTTHASFGIAWIGTYGFQPPHGGTMSDEAGSPQNVAVDRVFLADPWARDRKQCKWQDLRLPKDHPFVLSNGNPAEQVHRQKIGPNMGGISFGTKSCIPEIMKNPPKIPAAVLLPMTEKETKIDVIPQPKMQGPFEVVVEDSSTGAIYKRQVLLIEISQGISYVLPKPGYEAKLSEVREVVLEIDTRLCTKEVANMLQDKAIECFKSKISEQFPQSAFKSSNLYGYRRFVPKNIGDDHCVHQIMCKLPLPMRKSVLERSGVGIITVRDFVPRGGSIDDVTTIPRFWPVDRQAKDDALRTASGLDGFFGLVVTKRGIAARCTTEKIAVLRKALMPMDERIISLNENTVPRVIVESTGWPMAISPEQVVKATHHAVKKAPIPMRCYRSYGVTSWSLAFDSLPQLLKFTAKFNDDVCEILLTQNKQPKMKAQRTFSKQSMSNRPNQMPIPVPQLNDDAADRLGVLENKVANMEKRQDALETRISTGFDSVSDQLRQVLNAVQQRPKSPTGETPPPKLPKVTN